MSTRSLDKQKKQVIEHYCRTGYEHYDKQDYKSSIRFFYLAWVQIPKPQSEFVEAGWVLTALGDAYFRKHEYNLAIESLNSALHCPGADKNPLIPMRLGQVLWDSGNQNLARAQLFKAWQQSEGKMFKSEKAYYTEAIQDLIPSQNNDS